MKPLGCGGCDGGYVEVRVPANTVRPCPVCHPGHGRWASGQWNPVLFTRANPTRLDAETGLDWTAAIRRMLTAQDDAA